MKIKNLRYFGVFVVLALLLTACGAGAELPAVHGLTTTPLVEYSIDEGETWHNLLEDEVRRLGTTSLQLRRTREGAALEIAVCGDFSHPRFSGSITRMGDIVVAEGRGAVVIYVDSDGYARIILE